MRLVLLRQVTLFLKEKMGTYDFDKYINSLENVNVSGKSMIMLTGDEKNTYYFGKPVASANQGRLWSR